MFGAGGEGLTFTAPVGVRLDPTGAGAEGEFVVDAAANRAFVLEGGDSATALDEHEAERLMRATVHAWRRALDSGR